MTTWLSSKQYAQHRGISPPAITKHLKQGNIPKLATKKHGKRILINAEAADEALAGNTNAAANGGGVRRGKVNPDTGKNPGELPQSGERSLNDAKMKKEYYMAALSQLKYEKEKGKYIEALEVEKFQFERDRQIRDSLLNIPGRVSAMIAGMQNPTEQQVHEIILKEITDSLHGLSK